MSSSLNCTEAGRVTRAQLEELAEHLIESREFLEAVKAALRKTPKSYRRVKQAPPGERTPDEPLTNHEEQAP